MYFEVTSRERELPVISVHDPITGTDAIGLASSACVMRAQVRTHIEKLRIESERLKIEKSTERPLALAILRAAKHYETILRIAMDGPAR